jgi:hypothetical protein
MDAVPYHRPAVYQEVDYSGGVAAGESIIGVIADSLRIEQRQVGRIPRPDQPPVGKTEP